MAQFYTLLTQVGQAKLANAVALGNTIELTHLAVGDGGGSVPTPDSDRTALINEVRRAPINRVEVDADNPNWVVVEQVMPPDVGGWTIREIGVFDSAGDLIAYGNYPETYKPTLDEGSGRTQTVRMVLQVSDTAAVTLKVDPSVVLATRQYADSGDTATAQAAAQALQEHAESVEAHVADQIKLKEEIAQVPVAETLQQALSALGDFAAEGFQNIAVFETPGSNEWTVPDVLKQGLRKAYVTVIGGGGGGGSSSSSVDCGGGGGGGIAYKILDLTGHNSILVTVGAGGNLTAGGSSSFGSYLSATGGRRGSDGGYRSGAPGGVGIGGDINSSLGPGGAPIYDPISGGIYRGGHGGGPGGRGAGYLSTSVSSPALGPGGGGGGGNSINENGQTTGADGIVIVRW
ncbi:phage tail protein [Halomonas sp. JS92-SW72]|uniref:phage tail protein n=1 Tax=Halomonas sp. JS92-SW72 TaxID=2306583 RepID=UPI000E5B9D7B|nr:phage tail protein [Halomonas sp. JS92-SW72]AXY41081.1 phage tail protein [Halomonas sp. JS92-SW72]